ASRRGLGWSGATGRNDEGPAWRPALLGRGEGRGSELADDGGLLPAADRDPLDLLVAALGQDDLVAAGGELDRDRGRALGLPVDRHLGPGLGVDEDGPAAAHLGRVLGRLALEAEVDPVGGRG